MKSIQEESGQTATDTTHNKPILDELLTTELNEEKPLPECFGTLFDEAAEECSGCAKRTECDAKQNGAPDVPTADSDETAAPNPSPLDERDDPLSLAINESLRYRHLTESQRAMAAARIKPTFEAAAKKRQGTRNDLMPTPRRSGCHESKGDMVEDLPPRKGWECREAAAMALNVSPRSVEDAVTVLKSGIPELAKAVDSGEIRVSAAAEIAKLPHKEQLDAIKSIRPNSREKPDKDSYTAYNKAFLAYKQAIADACIADWHTVTKHDVIRDLTILIHGISGNTNHLAA